MIDKVQAYLPVARARVHSDLGCYMAFINQEAHVKVLIDKVQAHLPVARARLFGVLTARVGWRSELVRNQEALCQC